MVNDKVTLLEECVFKISQCINSLNTIASTYYMQERSEIMKSIFTALKNISSAIKQAGDRDGAVEECIKHIGVVGGKVGYLYATCCTVDREPLYQNIFKKLNQVHGRLWGVLGHSH